MTDKVTRVDLFIFAFKQKRENYVITAETYHL